MIGQHEFTRCCPEPLVVHFVLFLLRLWLGIWYRIFIVYCLGVQYRTCRHFVLLKCLDIPRSLKKCGPQDHQQVIFRPKCVDCFCGPVDKMRTMKVRTTTDTTDLIVREIGHRHSQRGPEGLARPPKGVDKNLYNRFSCAKGTNIMQKSYV